MSDRADVVEATAHHRVGVILLFYQVVYPLRNLAKVSNQVRETGKKNVLVLENALVLTDGVRIVAIPFWTRLTL
jgi:hypothetical protein